MRDTFLSNCEKDFINKCIGERKRIDGRKLDEFRKLKINFGREFGSVQVSLGETRCLVTVSCEVVVPKASRPNEGQLFINVDFGPMAAPHFEAGKMPEIGVQVSRILERAFTDSRCVDLESLCLVSEEKAWSLRVDVAVLNDSGNVCDCASIGILAALSHFRRPDVTTLGDTLIVHTDREKDPIPLVLHHFPVCVSFAVFESGEFSVADPTSLEEKVSKSNLVFGLNSYKELCGLHLGGVSLTSPDLLVRTAQIAAKQAKTFVEFVKQAVEADKQARDDGVAVSFMNCIKENTIKTSELDRIPIKLRKSRPKTENVENKIPSSEEQESVVTSIDSEVVSIDKNSAVLMPISTEESKKWVPESEESDTDDQEGDPQPTPEKRTKKSKKKKQQNDDSEEEETMQQLD